MTKMAGLFAAVVGIAFIILAIVYWVTPAQNLPAYIPGYSAGVGTIHFKHGIASLLLGLAALAYAWFTTGKKN